MSAGPMETGGGLHVERHFEAPRERVFAAWTDPEEIRVWFGGPEVVVEAAEVDLRVGGRYAITVREPDGGTTEVSGRYLEVRVPEKLVFTWRVRGSLRLPDENTVTVEFHDLGGRTRIVLDHAPFPDAETRERHAAGWAACLDGIAGLL